MAGTRPFTMIDIGALHALGTLGFKGRMFEAVCLLDSYRWNDPQRLVDLTYDQMAAALGVTRNTAVETVGRLERLGAIKRCGGGKERGAAIKWSLTGWDEMVASVPPGVPRNPRYPETGVPQKSGHGGYPKIGHQVPQKSGQGVTQIPGHTLEVDPSIDHPHTQNDDDVGGEGKGKGNRHSNSGVEDERNRALARRLMEVLPENHQRRFHLVVSHLRKAQAAHPTSQHVDPVRAAEMIRDYPQPDPEAIAADLRDWAIHDPDASPHDVVGLFRHKLRGAATRRERASVALSDPSTAKARR